MVEPTDASSRQSTNDYFPESAVDCDALADYKIVPGPDADRLSTTEFKRYRAFRLAFIGWLHRRGKDPSAGVGYAPKTVENTAYRTSKFMRYVWDLEGTFTLELTHEHADRYLDDLAAAGVSGTHGDQERKALLRLYRFLEATRGDDPWEPTRSFSPEHRIHPPDYLSLDERGRIREAARGFEPIPGYNDLSPGARNRWRRYLAEILDTEEADILPADWCEVPSWKVTSLVWTSLDGGLRPHEVEHARVTWVDTANALLRIPGDDATKSDENWHVALTEGTTRSLARWLYERELYDHYADTDLLWLTREGNPYTAQSLRRLLHRLCEAAGIAVDNRRMSWYAIRHSVGTYMVRERGLAAAQAQLRHKRPETTMKYDAVPVEDRRAALERMG